MQNLKSLIHNFFSNIKIVQIIVFFVASLVYLNTIPHQWAIDDTVLITDNRFTKRGLAGLDSIFTENTFYGHFGNKELIAGNRWRPFTQAMFALEVELFAANQKDAQGLPIKDDAGFVIKDVGENTLVPKISHLINVLLYGLLCVVLYKVLLLFTVERTSLVRAEEEHRLKSMLQQHFIAFVATILFALHPLHTEVVANVKGRDEIMALLGALVALYCVFKTVERTSVRTDDKHRLKSVLQYLGFASIAFFISLLSKENGITFLAIIPLALWFFSAANLKTIAIYTSPLLVVTILFLGLRMAVVGDSKLTTFETDELLTDPFLMLDEKVNLVPLVESATVQKLASADQNTYHKMPYSNQLATVIYSAGIYLKLLFIPHPLTTDYYPRHIAVQSFTSPAVLLALSVHLALLGWALLRFTSKSLISFAILYYFATFSIVSNFIFPIGTNLSERFMFMPSIGFVLIVAYGLYELWLKADFRLVTALFLLICVLFSGKTIARNFEWKNNDTLFAQDILVSGNSAKMNTDYTICIFNEAQREFIAAQAKIADLPKNQQAVAIKIAKQKQLEKVSKVLPNVEKSLAIHPIYAPAWLIYGSIHYNEALAAENPTNAFSKLYLCITAYEQAIKYQPNNPIMRENVAAGYREMGKFLGEKQGDLAKSIFFLEKSLAFNSEDASTYFLLGTACSMANQCEKAVIYAEKSLAMQPKDIEVKKNLAIIYQNCGITHNKKEWIDKSISLLSSFKH